MVLIFMGRLVFEVMMATFVPWPLGSKQPDHETVHHLAEHDSVHRHNIPAAHFLLHISNNWFSGLSLPFIED